MASQDELLRQQAVLLAQADAELVQLKLQHQRVLDWWSSFQGLAASLDEASTLPDTCARCATILTTELGFQIACVLTLNDAGASIIVREPPLAAAAGESGVGLLDASVLEMLRQRRAGFTNNGAQELPQLAAWQKIDRFFYCLITPSADLNLLLIAGMDARRARYRPALHADEAAQFQWIGQQVQTLLRNVLLVQKLAQHEQLKRLSRELEAQQQELQLRLQTILNQAQTIRQLSAPVLEVWEGVLVLPIIGELTSERGEQLLHSLLSQISQRRARCAILDVTGLATLDLPAASYLLKMSQAAALLGATCVLTGIRGEVAQTLVSLGIDLATLLAFRDLHAGLKACVRRLAPSSQP